jgi:hypothetical protein
MAVANRPASNAGPEFGLVAGVSLGFVVLLALIWYTFLRYPASIAGSGTGPKASLPIWLGDSGAMIAYLILGAVIALLYIGVAAVGARASHPADEQPWRIGAALALLSGATWLILGVAAKLFSPLEPVSALSPLLIITLPGLSGLLAARRSGQLATGALAGFWCGATLAILFGVVTITLDHLFVGTLLRTTWAHDTHCAAHMGDALAACELSDDLGFVATMLTLFPFAGWLFGALGSAIGVSLAPKDLSETQPPTPKANPLLAPAIFSGALAAIFVVELIWNLW